MRNVTDAALKERARSLIVEMTRRDRWIYALPGGTFERVDAILGAHGLPRIDDAADGTVARYQGERERPSFVLFDHRKLGVVLLEGRGEEAEPIFREVLEATGFVPQSQLWAAALEVGAPDCSKALATLAHMMVVWDEDWVDVFVLHLASPDAVVRHDAVEAVTLAAMVAHDAEPALELLGEALSREKFPKLAETIREAMGVLEAFANKPVEPPPAG